MRAVHRPAAAAAAPSAAPHAAPYAREHDDEAQPGLPEPLPASERILWQGSPDWKRLARRAFHLRKLTLYFAAVLALRVVFVLSEGGTVAAAARSLVMLLPLAALALGLLALIAWLSARSTVYTVTTRRVVMRIGIVLTLSFNLPYKRIAAANLRLDADGIGDVPLELAADERIAWMHLWPHCRPGHITRPQPMLRSVAEAAEVARLLSDAWVAATGGAVAAPAATPPAATLPAGSAAAAAESSPGARLGTRGPTLAPR
jgi:hypothetical protein